ncbi:MAG: monovalent cation/H+ antiporter complex subunit F [Candidatus Krumholzibacteriota bacterium]
MVDLILKAALVFAGSGVALATVQLLRGPDAPNRAVALDVLTLITMPLLVGSAIFTGRIIYLDVALVYAVLAFLGVVALARYYDRGI